VLVLTDRNAPPAKASGGRQAGHGSTKPFTISAGPATVLDASSGGVYCVSFSPDGSSLASANVDGTVKLWAVATRTRTATLTHADTDLDNPAKTVGGTKSWSAYTVAYSPDSSIVASGNGDNDPSAGRNDGVVQLWDVASRTMTASLTSTNSGPGSLAFSPDGATLANVNGSGTITLWHVATRISAATLTSAGYAAKCVAFSPDGTTLAGGGTRLMVWKIRRS
jgi:WD40 repeat protein